MRFIVTGANGFVGRAVFAALRERIGASAIGTTRREAGPDHLPVGDLGPATDWRAALNGGDVVIHTAARVHMMKETSPTAHEEYVRSNVEGTLALARQAVESGVRRFVFVSSIKVNGEGTTPGQSYSATDVPDPHGDYAQSKAMAEERLRDLAAQTGLELVIIRPPLVYGPGVGANFAAMMRWVARGIPLPLGQVDNRRSMVAIDNLVDLIVTSAIHPLAPGHVFLVSDGQDLSTSDLLRRLGNALERPARLLPVPPALLLLGASLLGRGAVARRLLGSLQVDIEPTRRILQWTPPVSVDEGLMRAVRGMRQP